MQENLRAILERLLKHDVDFVLCGGLACVDHGSPQYTADVDICISINPEQVEKLRGALREMSSLKI